MISTLIIQGFIFSLVAMAVYTTSRVIRKDDLSVEGSFSLGGSLTALMLEHSTSSCFTLAACLLIGALAGLCTGLLYSRLKMNHLMAGLTTTTACFSISLGLGSANKVVDSKHTIFESVHFINGPVADVGITAVIAVAVLLLIHSLLKSEIGLLLRATGENPWFVQSLGKSSGFYYCLGFCIANALVSLAGSLFVQWSLFFSITGSVGTLVTGLASLMMAELIQKKLGIWIIAASIGYQGILAASIAVGVAPIFNNLIKALIMVTLVIASHYLAKKQKGDLHA